jgi:mannose-6-phosphate isomerase-like protein (cupin superfamily)
MATLRQILAIAPWQKTASGNPGFLGDIDELTIQNTDYRRVLFTSEHNQLVVMSLKPGDDIGKEVHDVDQFFRFEAGKGKIIMDDFSSEVSDGDSIIVPSGVKHNIMNISKTEDLKLYSVYSPPNHRKDVVHKTKADAIEEPFDGKTDVK